MKDLGTSKIGELVAEDYRKAGVFKKYGLDFCCGGGKSIHEACEKKGINEAELIEAIRALDAQPKGSQQNFKDWEADFLADYIVNIHHVYVRENIPLILQFAQKAAKVHGHAHPELIEIEKRFRMLSDELSDHMQKEEMILFPYVKKLSQSGKMDEPFKFPSFGTVVNPIGMMEHEHVIAGELLEQIRELSNAFTPPEYACNTWKVLYAHLADFENDLHTHIHLENNILFPKAVQLEDALRPE
jgi:regulator of cell morphogenesis and NO signaling